MKIVNITKLKNENDKEHMFDKKKLQKISRSKLVLNPQIIFQLLNSICCYCKTKT